MKKSIFGILFLALVGIIFVSCKKDSLKSKSHESIELKEGVYSSGKLLVFSTYEEYEATVQMTTPEVEKEFLSKVSKMKHTTYAEAQALEKNNVDLVDDEFLAQILNNDLAVQIGSWIYRINKPTEKVFALAVENASEYNDLVSENLSNPNVLEFSTEENVIELLEPGLDFGEKALSDRCQSSQTDNDGGWQDYADWIDENGIYGVAGRRYKFKRKMRVRYDNWGIYRKLFAEFEHKESFGGTWDETHFSMQVYGNYTVKNGSTGNFSLFPAYQIYGTGLMNSTADYFYDFLDNRKELQIYRGTRCLSRFDLRGWAVFRNRATRKPNLAPNHGTGVHIIGS